MKTRKNHRRLRGGLAIQGTQGCVTIPSLLVDRFMKTRNAQYVTKLFFSEKDFEDEKAQNDRILKSIDPTGSFTSASYDMKPIDIKKITPVEISECPSLKGKDLSKLKYMNYKYLGKSINSILDEDTQFDINGSKDILRALANLSVKVLAMNSKGVYHNDAHGGNIMYNPKVQFAYLIDFGYLGDTKDTLVDLLGIAAAVKAIANLISSSSKITTPYRSVILQFMTDFSKIIAETRSLPDDASKQMALVKLITNFSNKYNAIVGGNRKTLKHRRR